MTHPPTAQHWHRFWSGRTESEQTQPPSALPDFYRREAEVIRLLTRKPSPSSVLELGCAGGEQYEASGWSTADYTGVDFSEGMLKRFRDRHPGAHVLLGDASAFVDRSRTFDLIFSNSVTQYFDRVMFRRHLENARTMLAPDGVLLCGEVRWSALLLQRIIADIRYTRKYHAGTGLFSVVGEVYDEIFRTTSFRVSELQALAADTGLTCEVFGSLNAPGTLDVCMRPIP